MKGDMMKGNILILILATTITIIGCPTCVGRIKTDSPPFFSDSFYKTHEEKNDYQQPHNQSKKYKESMRERTQEEEQESLVNEMATGGM